jgi:hypothetical protein
MAKASPRERADDYKVFYRPPQGKKPGELNAALRAANRQN